VAAVSRWRNPYQWARAHPRAFDAGIALVLIVGSYIDLATMAHRLPKGTHAPNLFTYLMVPVGCLPLLWRRRHSITALAVSTIAVMVVQNLHYPDTMLALSPAVAAYSAGAYLQSRRTLRITAGVLIGGLVVTNMVGAFFTAKGNGVATAVGNGIVFGTAFLLGDNMRRRRQRIADLEARATAEQTTRDLLARDAVTAERQRIARELHDVVAHSLSVMVVQAGAARRSVTTKPDQAVAALAAIESTGRDALDEMRRLLGVLRSADADTAMAPQPSVADLSTLVRSDPGLRVVLVVEGEAVGLPAAVDLQAYRIVQEALTNVRKHGGDATATVVVRYGTDAIEVRVDDDGRGASTRPDTRDGHQGDHRGGHGIVGMRERAALCGGDLRAGPRPGGGWTVVAHLPYAVRKDGAA